MAVKLSDGVYWVGAVDWNVRRGVDAEPDLLAADVDDRDLDVVADHDRLVSLSGKHQH